MSDLIRMLGMKASRGGTCNKCGLPRDKANHKNCDRWPTMHGSNKGFHYVANSTETTIADLKKMVDIICKGDADNTPIRFEIKVIQTANAPEVAA